MEKQQQQEQAQRKPRSDHWLVPGIVVKLIHKKLPDEIYKQKAVVEALENRYTAVVRLLSTAETKLKVSSALCCGMYMYERLAIDISVKLQGFYSS